MVAIYSVLNPAEGKDLRAFLIACGIPCKIVYGDFDLADTCSLVNIIENGSETPKGADPESILFSNFDSEEYAVEKMRLYSRMLDILDVKYGINPEFVLTELYSDTYTDVRFCGTPIKLSGTQRLLLKYLAVNAHRWCSVDELASCCLVNGGTRHHVAVQMDNIRKHAQDMTGKLIFDAKRGSGYKLLTSVKRP